jgi:wyosine [tRNA(Phe)-imidazoG37] synthetase (radical SAM superfamily)
LPDKVEKLVKVGLNSIRISLNSVIPEIYNEYFKPVDYKYEDVIETVQLCRENDIFTMINYLIFPGVNDTEEEFDTLCGLLDWPGVDFIHFKNLCIDPEYYVDNVSRGKGKVLGIRALFELLRKAYPDVEIGYFNKNIGKFIGYD